MLNGTTAWSAVRFRHLQCIGDHPDARLERQAGDLHRAAAYAGTTLAIGTGAIRCRGGGFYGGTEVGRSIGEVAAETLVLTALELEARAR